MECLSCDNGKAVAVESIHYAGTVYRRRKCKTCGYTFYTEELEIEDPRGLREALAYKKRMSRHKKESIKSE